LHSLATGFENKQKIMKNAFYTVVSNQIMAHTCMMAQNDGISSGYHVK
jgi:hypothetical protein